MASALWPRDTTPSRRFPVYTRLNATDVLPDPITPLGQTLLWERYVMRGWALGDVAIGAFRIDEISSEDTEPPNGFVYGHLYIDQSFTRVWGARAGLGVAGVDLMMYGNHPDAPAHVPSDQDEDEAAGAALAAFNQWAMTTQDWPQVEEDTVTIESLRRGRPDLGNLSRIGLVAHAKALLEYEKIAWISHNSATKASGVGAGFLGMLLGPVDPSLVLKVIGPAGDVDSATPSYALWALSREIRSDAAIGAAFDASSSSSAYAGLLDGLRTSHPGFVTGFEAFLADFGYRGPNEWDLGSASWETHPELVLGLLDRLRQTEDGEDPAIRRARQEAEATETLVRVLEIAGEEQAAITKLAVTSARRFGAYRERTKANAIKVIHEVRMAFLALGRRLVSEGVLDDPTLVFFAVADEVDHLMLEAETVVANLKERQQIWRDLHGLEVPMYLDALKPYPPLESLKRRTDSLVTQVTAGTTLTGVACAPGVVRGRARVVPDTYHLDAFEPGEILIAPQTDPSWTPLFMVAAGVVVDVGSMVSHAMIVSRELGVPCVGGVSDATRLIPDGALVEVDGAAGTVKILEI